MHSNTAGTPLPWWAYCVSCGNPHSAPEWQVTALCPSQPQGIGLFWWHVGSDLQHYTSVCKECCLAFAVADAVAELCDSIARAVSEFTERGGSLAGYTLGAWVPPLRVARRTIFWPPYPHRDATPPEWWLTQDPGASPHGWWAREHGLPPSGEAHDWSSESDEVTAEAGS